MDSIVSSKAELLARLHDRAPRLHALGVERIGLFGSFARDSVTSESDLDVLVEFVPGEKTFDRFMALSFFLEETTGREVDLLTLESLSPHIGPRILAEVEYVTIGD